jgi:hypothetical protein
LSDGVADSRDRRSLPPDEFVNPRIEYLTTRVYPRASEFWREIGSGFVFVEARLHVPHDQATRAALTLYDIDREARRAVRIIAGRGRFEPTDWDEPVIYRTVERARSATPRRLLRPTPLQVGGFRLLHAAEGSADFFLDAYGLLASVLLADPVQFALTLKSIFGWPGRVIVRRLGKRRETLGEYELPSEFDFQDKELRLTGRLYPGSRLELRYKGPDGSEIETSFES